MIEYGTNDCRVFLTGTVVTTSPPPPTTILIPTNQIDNKQINNKKKLLKLSNSPIDKTSRLMFFATKLHYVK